MSTVEGDYGETKTPCYLSAPHCAYLQYVEKSDAVPKKEYKDNIITSFVEDVIVTNKASNIVVDYSQASLEEIFGSCEIDLTIVGMYETSSPIQLQKLITRSDYMHGEPCEVVGTLFDLLSSGSCLRTGNIPMALSVYDLPLFLATDLKAWGETLDHPFANVMCHILGCVLGGGM